MPVFLDPSEIIKSSKNLPISILKGGWYRVFISAQVKSEKQRSKYETNDEDLTFQLDTLIFPKPTEPTDLKDSPAAFSGGTQHNQEKTVQIIVKLAAGTHSLSLLPQFQKIMPNERSLKHKQWIFSATPILDLFGREQIETFDLSQSVQLDNQPPLNYIELWADQSTLLKEVIFKGHDFSSELAIKGISEVSELKQYSFGPNGKNYNYLDNEIAKAVKDWNKDFTSQKFPPPNPLDPNLVKAMAYVESKVGLYPAPAGSYPATPDIMQIGDPLNPAIHVLNNDGWVDPATNKKAQEYEWSSDGPQILDHRGEANARTTQESISWAVAWLFHKAEVIHSNGNRSWRSWREAVSRHNGGGDENYVEKVYTIYKKGDWR